MKYPESLLALIECFEKYPGVGHKSAERLAFYTLNVLSVEEVNLFSNTLLEIKQKIKKCPICGNITDNEVCEICRDETRDCQTIMVLENVKDLVAIESTNEYHGLYHILNGTINFQEGITPDQLNIKSLIDRLNPNIKEVIIATSATVLGETTARYLKEIIKDNMVTRIAYGLPVGSNLDYLDSRTLLKAIEGRKSY